MRRFVPLAILLSSFAFALPACKRHETKLNAEAQRGHDLYLQMCAVCHGESGEGYRADRAPRLAQPDFLASVSDAYLRYAISDGRPGSTMSAWSKLRGGPLDAGDVNALVAFLRSWDTRPRVSLDGHPAAGEARRGEAVFAKECARCHGAKGTGGPYIQIGGRELLSSASVGFLRYAIRVGRPGTLMPGFASKLGDASIEDLLALLASWKAPAAAAGRDVVHPPPIPLGPVPLNPGGPPANGFKTYPSGTPLEVIKKGARPRRAPGAPGRPRSLRLHPRAHRRRRQCALLRSEPVLRPAAQGRLAGRLLLMPARRVGHTGAPADGKGIQGRHRARGGLWGLASEEIPDQHRRKALSPARQVAAAAIPGCRHARLTASGAARQPGSAAGTYPAFPAAR